jgi:hypothetical protein
MQNFFIIYYLRNKVVAIIIATFNLVKISYTFLKFISTIYHYLKEQIVLVINTIKKAKHYSLMPAVIREKDNIKNAYNSKCFLALKKANCTPFS